MMGEFIVEGVGFADGAGSADLRLLSTRQRRGLSECARLMVTAAAAALEDAELAGIDFAIVSGSSLGEIQTAEALCEMRVRGDGRTSPARFRNSVHNTVTGLLSIASGSHAPCTSVSAGRATVAVAILEAQLQIRHGAPRVLLVVADESVPQVFDPALCYSPVAGALLLARATGQVDEPTLELIRLAESNLHSEPPSTANPCTPMIEIVSSLRHRRTGAITLPGLHGHAWALQIGAPRGKP
jgi:3-oxoacyl-[acyl-carrier-protein] synthase III